MRFVIPLAMAVCSFAFPALAQMQCAPHDQIVGALQDNHAEFKQGWGLGKDRLLYELFTAPSGSWTLLGTPPGGPTCIFTHGVNWHGSHDTAVRQHETDGRAANTAE